MIDSRHRAVEWQSRQLVVTPEQLGLTAMPVLPYKQEFWRLDALLLWSRGNGFENLPMLGAGIAPRLK